MASICKRKNKNGTTTWRTVIRIKGYPSLSNRFILDGALQYHKFQEDTLRHIEYWETRLTSYALIHITPDLIGKERQHLLQTPTTKGKQRMPATVNRYLAALSSLLTYAARELKWIEKTPCLSLRKLKENSGRDRIFFEDEITRLLKACKESQSSYLYPIVLIALTTGARKGEIPGLERKHIDFENNLAYVKETKNGRPRSIPLTEAAMAAPRQIPKQSHKPLVFASKTAFRKIDINKAWKQAFAQANITNCRFHDLRHTFCTLAAAEGASNLELATATAAAPSQCPSAIPTSTYKPPKNSATTSQNKSSKEMLYDYKARPCANSASRRPSYTYRPNKSLHCDNRQ